MNRHCPHRGFTLVELLVVVGIIAIMISLLLPSLNKARRAAQTVACLANLRSLGQAMNMYAAQNHGYIPGSGMTSGRHLWRESGGVAVLADPSYNINSYAPLVNECMDWGGPLARVMGYKDRELHNDYDPAARFRWYVNLPVFRCPSNEGAVMTKGTNGIDLGVLPSFSYVTASAFLTIPHNLYPGTTSAGFIGNITWQREIGSGSIYAVAPAGYTPKLAKVGRGSEKIYMADGSKRGYFTKSGSVATWNAQRYVCAIDPVDTVNVQNIWSDTGAFWGDSQAYHREAVPGNATAGIDYKGIDGRLISFRHGEVKPFGPAGAYRMNAVFYDGHAETLDDLTASNPKYWLPRGTVFSNVGGGSSNQVGGVKVIWADARAKFLPPGTTWRVD